MCPERVYTTNTNPSGAIGVRPSVLWDTYRPAKSTVRMPLDEYACGIRHDSPGVEEGEIRKSRLPWRGASKSTLNRLWHLAELQTLQQAVKLLS